MTLTPEQFNLLATKDDLKSLEDRIDNKINKVLTAVDDIAKKFDDHEIEHVSNQAAHDRYEEQIAKLEKKVGIKEKCNAEDRSRNEYAWRNIAVCHHWL